MKLRNLLTASLLVATSSSAFAGAVDFTEVMSNTPSGTGRGVSCSINIGSQNKVNSRFQNTMLPSATHVKASASACSVEGLQYSASNSHNIFSQTPANKPTVVEFARFTLVDDADLLTNKTVLQAAVTR